MSQEFAADWFLLLITDSTSETMYCNCNGKIFNFLKYSLQESVVLAPIIILIILFCSLKIVLLHKEFFQTFIP